MSYSSLFVCKQMFIVSLLISCLVLNFCSSQPVLNTLSIYKHDPKGELLFNIKVNGKKYFETDQAVRSFDEVNPDEIPFSRELDDVIEVIFPLETSPFPGDYYIQTDLKNNYFDSTTNNFYPVNQCLTEEEPCNFKIIPIGIFPSKVTVNIYINGTLRLSEYAGNGPSP